MFYSQVILAKKGPLAKVWLAAHWGDKKLARPQIFATDISQSVESIVNPSVPLALRVSGHLLLGVVRIYSRKVKYVLTDCTEAMLKLQMAFAPRKELLEQETSSSNNNNANLAPFGEFDQVHIVEGFCLPLPDQNEWILAEDNNDNDNDNDNIGNENDIDDSEEGMGIVAISTMDPSPSTPTVFQPPQEETWVPFDPNDDEEEDGDVHGSLVSDVEVVRAADESFLSGDQTRRDSSMMLLDKTQDEDLPATAAPEDPDDFGNIPFDDDDSEDQAGPTIMRNTTTTTNEEPPPPMDDSSILQLSAQDGHSVGLDVSGLEEASREETKRPAVLPIQPKRKRKRRKVVVDNDETELGNDHIKQMIADTEGLVRRQVHPAADDGDDHDHDHDDSAKQQQTQHMPMPICRPFLADDGQLHASLEHLWTQNYYRALDLPCGFDKVEDTDIDIDTPAAVEAVRDAQEDASRSDMEEEDEEEEHHRMTAPLNTNTNNDDDEEEEDEPVDFAAPMDDDDDEEQQQMQDQPPVFEDSDEYDEEVVRERQDTEWSDLGLVNELQIDSEADEEDDDDDEHREAIGDSSSTNSKWHKHTVKVLELLQRRMRPVEQNDNDDNDNEEQKPTVLQFQQISHNCTRRTAASVFFELLQLKTWDFIDLEQPEAYGDISIAAGVRFLEAPPNRSAA